MQPQAQLATRVAPVLPPAARVPGAVIAEDDGAAPASRRTSFAVPHDFGLGPVPRSLGPVRAPRSWVPDVVRHEKLPGGLAITTSLLETAGLTMALCDPVNTLVVPCAHVLHYQEVDRDGRVRDACHRPQVVTRRRDGGVLAYTFLATWERDRAALDWRRTEAAVRAAYRTLGVEFRVLTERTLFSRVLRENRARMLKERAGPGAKDDLERVHRALMRHGLTTTVARFHRSARPFPARRIDRTLACLMELALAGSIRLDLRQPLGSGTRIMRAAAA
ncbi:MULTISPECIES: hypothetical protein [unclassified Methylobacterium]|jgi:hypothetical protein|uniref:hypothetical protein n=1 Tax=unclassified Methylobacterium TaxID=2615210 RepID=UPI001355F746|nr:hypothetical protein [Methylobacterium sp. 2A]MWV24679.1 hypothetical protein [Methylobacterium sp. 2A]